MVFITHCWKRLLQFEVSLKAAVRHGRLACVALCWLCASLAHADPSVDLQELTLARQEGVVAMSGTWRFDLPAALEDALQKGITLYFVTEVDVYQERWYIYNQRVAHAERHIRLFYQPLTRRWRVHVSPQPFSVSGLGVSIGQSYDSADDAISAVRRIVSWRIANLSDLNLEAKPTININFKLDLKQLPRPMQIGAIGQSDWNISFSKTQRLELAP